MTFANVSEMSHHIMSWILIRNPSKRVVQEKGSNGHIKNKIKNEEVE